MTELARLFMQTIPYTFLGPLTGSFSCIDHILIDCETEWPEIKNVSIIYNDDEYRQLRCGNDWTGSLKVIWDWR
jgi:hypothetical protein